MKSWISKLKLQKPLLTGPWLSPMPVSIALVFISLVAATVIAALVVRANQETQSQRNLADAADVAMDSISINLDQGIAQLKAIQALFNASNFVTREEFGIFVERFLEEARGIQALEWTDPGGQGR